MYSMEVLCSTRDFYAYWYGNGDLVDVEPVADEEGNELSVFTVEYGEDKFRAEYQRDRFWSGLISAQVFVR